MKRLNLFLTLTLAFTLCFSPRLSLASDSDGAIDATHRSARAAAEAALYSHVFSILMSLRSGIANLDNSQIDDSVMKQLEQIKVRVSELDANTEIAGITSVEDQVLTDFSRTLDQLQADYRASLLNLNLVREQRRLRQAEKSNLEFDMQAGTRLLQSICRTGVARNYGMSGYTNPLQIPMDFKVMISFGFPSDGGAVTSQGKADGAPMLGKEGEAAFAVATSYLVTLFPYGTAAAAVLWAGKFLLGSEAAREEMQKKTDALLDYKARAARADDVQKYYRKACAPMSAAFEKISSDISLIRSAPLSDRSLKLIRVSMARQSKILDPIFDRIARLAKNLSAVYSKEAAADLNDFMKKNLSSERLPKVLEYILLSAALKSRDSKTEAVSTSEREAGEMMKQLFEKMHTLTGIEYRLHLLKQNPLLVQKLEADFQTNENARVLYKQWAALLVRVLSAPVVMTSEGDLHSEIDELRADLKAAQLVDPTSRALKQIEKRIEILSEVSK